MVGAKALSTTMATVVAAARKATGRQRGDSSRPVGNNSSVNTDTRLKSGNQNQLLYQAATIAPGSEPPRVM
jgi:hypothetical protein